MTLGSFETRLAGEILPRALGERPIALLLALIGLSDERLFFAKNGADLAGCLTRGVARANDDYRQDQCDQNRDRGQSSERARQGICV